MNGNASISGLLHNLNNNIKTANNIFIDGSGKIDTIIADTIEINGPGKINNAKINKTIFIGGSFTCKDVQCEEKIQLGGFCDFDTVSTKIVSIDLMNTKVINPAYEFCKFKDVIIDKIEITSDQVITVYVSNSSQIKEIKFLRKQGMIIYQ